jgi:hypothetical protein
MKPFFYAAILSLSSAAFAAHNTFVITPQMFSVSGSAPESVTIINDDGIYSEGTCKVGGEPFPLTLVSAPVPTPYPHLHSIFEFFGPSAHLINMSCQIDDDARTPDLQIDAEVWRLRDIDPVIDYPGLCNDSTFTSSGWPEPSENFVLPGFSPAEPCVLPPGGSNDSPRGMKLIFTLTQQNVLGDDCQEDLVFKGCTVEYKVPQRLRMSEGWNLISGFIIEDDMSVPAMLDDVAERVIIAKNNAGQAWLTEFDFNGIGEMLIGQGYQVKLSATDDPVGEEDWSFVDWLGKRVLAETPIALVAGWNLIGYLRSDPSDAMAVFGTLLDSNQLIIVKNNDGQALLAEWDFNGIGDMHSGQGYAVKVSEATQLVYLADHETY